MDVVAVNGTAPSMTTICCRVNRNGASEPRVIMTSPSTQTMTRCNRCLSGVAASEAGVVQQRPTSQLGAAVISTEA